MPKLNSWDKKWFMSTAKPRFRDEKEEPFKESQHLRNGYRISDADRKREQEKSYYTDKPSRVGRRAARADAEQARKEAELQVGKRRRGFRVKDVEAGKIAPLAKKKYTGHDSQHSLRVESKPVVDLGTRAGTKPKDLDKKRDKALIAQRAPKEENTQAE